MTFDEWLEATPHPRNLQSAWNASREAALREAFCLCMNKGYKATADEILALIKEQ